ncbi:hypothetical protein DVK44_11635 [Streptomyces paludis]|uniref:Uncharacterized protein n=2 Tax=Streptomyces paludis TaxID=2282738 RepID=A0A345I0Q8_9ACTN|nr:hypothetical protein DVK44_11635 [Streptomyces paludis]
MPGTPIVALMWEAKAAPDRAPDLLTWARARTNELTPAPLRHELLRAPGDRVLVIAWWPGAYDADVPELPDPEGELLARPVHRWRFESLGTDAAPPSGSRDVT